MPLRVFRNLNKKNLDSFLKLLAETDFTFISKIDIVQDILYLFNKTITDLLAQIAPA